MSQSHRSLREQYQFMQRQRVKQDWILPRDRCPICRKPFQQDEDDGKVPACACGDRSSIGSNGHFYASRSRHTANHKKGSVHAIRSV